MSVPPNMILVLACSKEKLDIPRAAAGELYRGTIYRKGKDIAEKVGLPFWILSAKYGFIRPDQIVDNYDQKFKKPYDGPFPPAPWHGFYLGGQLYFKHMPQSFQPLVTPAQIGYMLQELTILQRSPHLVQDMIAKHPGVAPPVSG